MIVAEMYEGLLKGEQADVFNWEEFLPVQTTDVSCGFGTSGGIYAVYCLRRKEGRDKQREKKE